MSVTIQELLDFTAENGASDLHLSSGLPPLVRISGDIEELNSPPLSAAEVYAMIESITNEEQYKIFRERWDFDMSYQHGTKARFRINLFEQTRGPGMVCRIIPSKIPSLDELGAPPSFKAICQQPRGIVLVTGPTGCGKSTTLAAMINEINISRKAHILTVEDPVEFVHQPKQSLINQREVKVHTKNFASSLRAALREDPDIILVGEMRDAETIGLALSAAETGHLVFGTLHTSSAAKTVDRVVDVFPASEQAMVRAMFAESLRAVVSQMLLKKIGGGRVAVHEIMIATPSIRNLIRENKVPQMYSAIQTGSGAGMQTLDQGLKILVQDGIIDQETALRVAVKKEDFMPQ